jgi:hypothetical protein
MVDHVGSDELTKMCLAMKPTLLLSLPGFIYRETEQALGKRCLASRTW